MEQQEAREIARQHNVRADSVHRAIQYGVEEWYVSDFLDIRRAARVSDGEDNYTPSVRMMAGVYRACEGDITLMSEVVGCFHQKAGTAKQLFEDAIGCQPTTWQDIREAYDVMLSDITAESQDGWFEKRAIDAARQNGHVDIVYEKRKLYRELGLSVVTDTESTLNRRKRYLTQQAFSEGFIRDFDLHPITDLINNETDHVQLLVDRFRLSGRSLRTYAEIYPLVQEFYERVGAKMDSMPLWQAFGQRHLQHQAIAACRLADITAPKDQPEIELTNIVQDMCGKLSAGAEAYWSQDAAVVMGDYNKYMLSNPVSPRLFGAEEGTRILIEVFGKRPTERLLLSFARADSRHDDYAYFALQLGFSVDAFEDADDEPNAEERLLRTIFGDDPKFAKATIERKWQSEIAFRQEQNQKMAAYIRALAGEGSETDES